MEDLQEFQKDVDFLVDTLKQVFEAEQARYTINAETDSLFIEIEGLEDFTDAEIEEMAGEVLEELDLDFDEIALLPLK